MQGAAGHSCESEDRGASDRQRRVNRHAPALERQREGRDIQQVGENRPARIGQARPSERDIDGSCLTSSLFSSAHKDGLIYAAQSLHQWDWLFPADNVLTPSLLTIAPRASSIYRSLLCRVPQGLFSRKTFFTPPLNRTKLG